MAEFLMEIGTEEIPADDLFALRDDLKRISERVFSDHRILSLNLQSEVTPRRLSLMGEVEPKQKDLREEKMGPPRKVAVNQNGEPTPAGLGFARNVGLSFERLKILQTPKGEYLAAEIVVKGRPVATILPEIIPSILSGLPFKKFMHWESSCFEFGRPIRRIVLMLDGKRIPFQVAGVSSGLYTFGHRFLGKPRIKVKTLDEYRQKLAENGVILRFEERLEKITTELHQHATSSNGKLLVDKELSRTMANEVEYPEVLTGKFSRDFLILPQEILINAMRKHQKYFCSVDESGRLLPVFHTVLNTHAVDVDLIRKGHERVLQARLRDAEFFWNEDRKTPLGSRSALLARLTYHVKLGSYAEKVQRMKRIAEELLPRLNLREQSQSLETLVDLSKNDLVTLMVGEFPELQGKMAGLYAREEGFPEPDWKALYDQYLPVSAEDSVPRNLKGALLSAVDRLEVLGSGYTLNMIPTGSKDPYALRRIATGLIKIILEYKLDFDLRPVLEHLLSLYDVKTKLSRGELAEGLSELLEARFRYLMEQKGIPHDSLNAILTVEKKSFVAAYGKCNALWAKNESNDLKILARGFKRIHNIITDHPDYTFNAEILQEDGEIRLYRAFSDLEFRVQQNIQTRDYFDALDIMVTLGPEIDNFFDEVLVMTEDQTLRQNRIALLQSISRLYRRIADFSALQIEL